MSTQKSGLNLLSFKITVIVLVVFAVLSSFLRSGIHVKWPFDPYLGAATASNPTARK